MVSVLIGGKFDPIHQGHLHYIHRAYELGDWLYIIVHPDDVVANTNSSGECLVPLWCRMELLQGILLLLGNRGNVIIGGNTEYVSKIIKRLRPKIYFKNGDRTIENIPQIERDACNEIGCQIIYEPSGTYDVSSSRIKGYNHENG